MDGCAYGSGRWLCLFDVELGEIIIERMFAAGCEEEREGSSREQSGYPLAPHRAVHPSRLILTPAMGESSADFLHRVCGMDAGIA